MSLDRWFGKDLTNKLPTPPNSDGCIAKKPRPIKSIRVAPKPINPRRQLYRAKRGTAPDLTGVVMRQLNTFTEQQQAAPGGTLFSVGGLQNHDVIFAGLKGEVLLFDSNHVGYGSIEFKNEAPVRDFSLFPGNEKQFIACSDNSISICDTANFTTTLEFSPVNIFGFQTVSAAANNLIVTATKIGSAYVADPRENKITTTIWDAHDPQRRLRQGQNLRGPALTSAEWCGSQTIATSSVQDQTVKFWDLRKATSPVNSVTMQNRAPIGGITCLKQDSDHKVWALGKNGSLESMLPTLEHSIDIYSGGIELSNYSASMCIIEDRSFASGLIACGGKDALTVVNRPTLESAYSYTNNMMGYKLNSAATFSSVFWHGFSNTLIAAGYDTHTCHFWKRI